MVDTGCMVCEKCRYAFPVDLDTLLVYHTGGYGSTCEDDGKIFIVPTLIEKKRNYE